MDRRIFNVSDFGAVANSRADSGPAIRKAIDAAIATGEPADVVLSDGNYRVGSVSAGAWWRTAAIVVSGAKDLVLRGSGRSVLVVTDPSAAGVVLRDCQRVVAQRFIIDYDPVPQVLSKIVAIDPDAGFMEVENEPGDPDLMTFSHADFQDPNMRVLGSSYQIDEKGSPVWGAESAIFTMPVQIGPNRWKLSLPADPKRTRRSSIAAAGLRVGDLFVSSSFSNCGAAFSMINNKVAEAREITLYSAPGLAFFPHRNDSVKVIGCVIEIKPGSHRVLSTNADGIHARSNRHIVIENCSFSGTGDDGINLHATAAVPLQRLSPTCLVFRRHTYSIREGDTLEQVRPETTEVVGRYLVKSVDDTAKDGTHVEFAEAPGDVHTGKDLTEGDQFFNLDESNDDFIVRDNVFATHRGRDLLIEACRGVVEHNRFNNQRGLYKPLIDSSNPGYHQALLRLTCTSIQIGYDPNWGEGPVTEGVTIRDNIFAGNEYPSPAIWIQDNARPQPDTTASGSHKDITIEGNVFKNRNTPPVVARFVKNLVIKDNTVSGKGVLMGAAPTDPAFDLRNCDSPIVSGNILDEGLFTKEAQE